MISLLADMQQPFLARTRSLTLKITPGQQWPFGCPAPRGKTFRPVRQDPTVQIQEIQHSQDIPISGVTMARIAQAQEDQAREAENQEAPAQLLSCLCNMSFDGNWDMGASVGLEFARIRITPVEVFLNDLTNLE